MRPWSKPSILFKFIHSALLGKMWFKLFSNLYSCIFTFFLESKFLSVIAGPLKNIIGLTDTEIEELSSYFKVADGRIYYTQFCEMIHNDSTMQ